MRLVDKEGTMSFTNGERRVSTSEAAEAQRKKVVERAHARLTRLLEITGRDDVLHITEVRKGAEATCEILFFEFDPAKLPVDIINDLLLSMNSMIHHSLTGSTIHTQLDAAQKEIQLARYHPLKIIDKLTRHTNPHKCWLALNISKQFIRVVGCAFFDPEVVTKVAEYDEYDEQGESESQQIIATGPEMKGLWVDDGYQEHGIARKLTAKVKQHNWRTQKRDLLALVPHNEKAMRFFEANGFENQGLTLVKLKKEGKEKEQEETIDFWFYVVVCKQLEQELGVNDSTQTS